MNSFSAMYSALIIFYYKFENVLACWFLLVLLGSRSFLALTLDVLDIVLVPLSLTLNKFYRLCWCFHSWLWISVATESNSKIFLKKLIDPRTFSYWIWVNLPERSNSWKSSYSLFFSIPFHVNYNPVNNYLFKVTIETIVSVKYIKS